MSSYEDEDEKKKGQNDSGGFDGFGGNDDSGGGDNADDTSANNGKGDAENGPGDSAANDNKGGDGNGSGDKAGGDKGGDNKGSKGGDNKDGKGGKGDDKGGKGGDKKDGDKKGGDKKGGDKKGGDKKGGGKGGAKDGAGKGGAKGGGKGGGAKGAAAGMAANMAAGGDENAQQAAQKAQEAAKQAKMVANIAKGASKGGLYGVAAAAAKEFLKDPATFLKLVRNIIIIAIILLVLCFVVLIVIILLPIIILASLFFWLFPGLTTNSASKEDKEVAVHDISEGKEDLRKGDVSDDALDPEMKYKISDQYLQMYNLIRERAEKIWQSKHSQYISDINEHEAAKERYKTKKKQLTTLYGAPYTEIYYKTDIDDNEYSAIDNGETIYKIYSNNKWQSLRHRGLYPTLPSYDSSKSMSFFHDNADLDTIADDIALIMAAYTVAKGDTAPVTIDQEETVSYIDEFPEAMDDADITEGLFNYTVRIDQYQSSRSVPTLTYVKCGPRYAYLLPSEIKKMSESPYNQYSGVSSSAYSDKKYPSNVEFKDAVKMIDFGNTDNCFTKDNSTHSISQVYKEACTDYPIGETANNYNGYWCIGSGGVPVNDRDYNANDFNVYKYKYRIDDTPAYDYSKPMNYEIKMLRPWFCDFKYNIGNAPGYLLYKANNSNVAGWTTETIERNSGARYYEDTVYNTQSPGAGQFNISGWVGENHSLNNPADSVDSEIVPDWVSDKNNSIETTNYYPRESRLSTYVYTQNNNNANKAKYIASKYRFISPQLTWREFSRALQEKKYTYTTANGKHIDLNVKFLYSRVSRYGSLQDDMYTPSHTDRTLTQGETQEGYRIFKDGNTMYLAFDEIITKGSVYNWSDYNTAGQIYLRFFSNNGNNGWYGNYKIPVGMCIDLSNLSKKDLELLSLDYRYAIWLDEHKIPSIHTETYEFTMYYTVGTVDQFDTELLLAKIFNVARVWTNNDARIYFTEEPETDEQDIKQEVLIDRLNIPSGQTLEAPEVRRQILKRNLDHILDAPYFEFEELVEYHCEDDCEGCHGDEKEGVRWPNDSTSEQHNNCMHNTDSCPWCNADPIYAFENVVVDFFWGVGTWLILGEWDKHMAPVNKYILPLKDNPQVDTTVSIDENTGEVKVDRKDVITNREKIHYFQENMLECIQKAAALKTVIANSTSDLAIVARAMQFQGGMIGGGAVKKFLGIENIRSVWGAGFISYCAHWCDIDTKIIPKSNDPNAFKNIATAEVKYSTSINKNTLKTGDIVYIYDRSILKFTANTTWGAALGDSAQKEYEANGIGLVVSVDKDNNAVYVIEGCGIDTYVPDPNASTQEQKNLSYDIVMKEFKKGLKDPRDPHTTVGGQAYTKAEAARSTLYSKAKKGWNADDATLNAAIDALHDTYKNKGIRAKSAAKETFKSTLSSHWDSSKPGASGLSVDGIVSEYDSNMRDAIDSITTMLEPELQTGGVVVVNKYDITGSNSKIVGYTRPAYPPAQGIVQIGEEVFSSIKSNSYSEDYVEAKTIGSSQTVLVIGSYGWEGLQAFKLLSRIRTNGSRDFVNTMQDNHIDIDTSPFVKAIVSDNVSERQNYSLPTNATERQNILKAVKTLLVSPAGKIAQEAQKIDDINRYVTAVYAGCEVEDKWHNQQTLDGIPKELPYKVLALAGLMFLQGDWDLLNYKEEYQGFLDFGGGAATAERKRNIDQLCAGGKVKSDVAYAQLAPVYAYFVEDEKGQFDQQTKNYAKKIIGAVGSIDKSKLQEEDEEEEELPDI